MFEELMKGAKERNKSDNARKKFIKKKRTLGEKK